MLSLASEAWTLTRALPLPLEIDGELPLDPANKTLAITLLTRSYVKISVGQCILHFSSLITSRQLKSICVYEKLPRQNLDSTSGEVMDVGMGGVI